MKPWEFWEFTPRDFFEYANIQLEERKNEHEKTLEYLGELLASIHNNGNPYEGKKGLERKDFIKLSYDPVEDEEDVQDVQEMMRQANESLSKLMNPDGN